MFELDRDAWISIEQDALKDYPDECCGLVTMEGEGAQVVHACDNIQNKLHAQDPVEHPRKAKTAYRMDDLQVLKILTATEDAGGKLVAIYHSHIDCEAYFSEEDQTAAQVFGEPAYPGVAYIVVSVVDGKSEDRKVFGWTDASGQFEEYPLSVT